MNILIKEGRVLDPASKTDKVIDVLIKDGFIAAMEENIDESQVDEVIDASGCMVMPGLVDLNAHFREPGLEHKETIRTGSRAAARGGYTTVCMMPNTKPVIDNVDMLQYVTDKAEEVTEMWYKERMAPEGVKVYNPAFDVADHELIAGIVTEYGVARAPYTESLKEIMERKAQRG